MKTEIIRMTPDRIDYEAIERAGNIIRSGGLVAFPTETVYGLGGDALNPEASAKIYAAKGRPSDNPLIVHIADMDHLAAVTNGIPQGAEALAERLWPGPLTMIFERSDAVPYETTGGLETVAVRMPSNPIAAALIRASGGYIAAPSANISGRPSPTIAEHVIEDLDGRVDMIIDGGAADIGLESTIIDFTEDTPMILRPGFITPGTLREILGDVKIDPGITDSAAMTGRRPKAPGMRYRHYAPKAQLFIVEGGEDAVTNKIGELVRKAADDGLKTGVIAADETKDRYHADIVIGIGSRKSEETIARHLFRVLRDMDEAGADVIYSESFDTPRMGMAIMNRLLKAAGHQVLTA